MVPSHEGLYVREDVLCSSAEEQCHRLTMGIFSAETTKVNNDHNRRLTFIDF